MRNAHRPRRAAMQGLLAAGLFLAIAGTGAFGEEEKTPAGAEPPRPIRVFQALPVNTAGFVYVPGYERMKDAFKTNPLVLIMEKPVFAPLRRFLWGKLDNVDGWMQQAGGGMHMFTRFNRQEVFDAFKGPVVLALREDNTYVFIADVSTCRDANAAFMEKFNQLYREIAEGLAPAVLLHKGHNIVLFELGHEHSPAYVVAGDVFIASLGENGVMEALDALVDGNGLAAAREGFKKALGRFDFNRVDAFAYANGPAFLKFIEAEGRKADLRAWKAAGIEGVKYFAAAEERTEAGVVDRLVCGMSEWYGVFGGLRKYSLKDGEVGASYPAKSLVVIKAAVSPQGFMISLIQGFARAQQNEMQEFGEARMNKLGLLLVGVRTAYAGLMTQAGAWPTGEVSAAVLSNDLIGPIGVAGRLQFAGDTPPLDALQKTLKFLKVSERNLAQAVAELPEGRLWLLGRGRGDNPFTLAFLEKDRELIVSPDATVPPILASLVREKSLRAKDAFIKATEMEGYRRFFVLYISPEVYDIPFRAGGLFLGGIRRQIMENTGGFDVLTVAGISTEVRSWKPAALVLGYDDDALEIRLVSPCGILVPAAGGALAAILKEARFGEELDEGALAGVVPDLGIAPTIDGSIESLYREGLTILLEGKAARVNRSRVAFLTSGGKLYLSGRIIARGGMQAAGAGLLELGISTGPEYAGKIFSVKLSAGNKPAYVFDEGNTPWSPRAEYRERKQGNAWSFELAIPLTDFFIDPATASPLWRVKVTGKMSVKNREEPVELFWGEEGAPAGYVIFQTLKGEMPQGIDIDAVLSRRKRARPPRIVEPVPPPPVEPEPEVEMVF